MSAKDLISKYKPIIIILILFFLVFFIRAEAASINGVPDQMKAYYEDQNGQPYFSEMDSYYNLRLTADLLDHGYLGDTKINGTQWDLHSSYPSGQSAEYPPLISIITVGAYKLANAFAKVPLAAVAFWMGPIVGSLAVIPAYLLIRRITNDYGGVAAGLLVGLAPAYFSHTFAGFFDTDMFNMLLPLLVVYFFVLSMLAKDIKKKTIFGALSAFSMMIFTMAWQGWWYIFYIIIGSAVVYLILTQFVFKLEPKPMAGNFKGNLLSKFAWFKDKPDLYSLVVFIVLSLLLMGLVLGVSGLASALTEPVSVSKIQSTVGSSSYPNVYVSVSELQIPGLSDIINGVGGYLPFIFGILGIVALIWRFFTIDKVKEEEPTRKRKPRRKSRSKRKEETKEVEPPEKPAVKLDIVTLKRNYILYTVLFGVWLVITIYAMTKGVRFIENFSLPITLTAGIFVGLLYYYVKDHVENVSYQKVIMAVVLIAVAFSPVASAYSISNSVVPGTDDSMVNSLSYIKNNTPNNTVITSWWDYGHLFTDVADRAATFDGSSQNSPRAYWVGKALLTDNETLSAGILRMLASSGDLAPQTLDNYTNNSGKSADILNGILGLNKTDAITAMTSQYGLTQDQAQTIAQYTHPDNPTPHVFITSSDMVGKAGWWSYFGSWNFTSNNGTNYQYLASQLNSTTINNKTLYIGGNAVVAQQNGTSYSAGIIDTSALTTNDTNTIVTQISNELTTGNGSLLIEPHTLTIINSNNITQQVVSNSSQYSILLINQNNTLIGVAMNKELENSMFTRLFFEGGAGLTQFKALYGQPGVMVWGVS
ncbi:Oligosaccharyl transferase STT3 subunit [Methanobacterium lacus]|uniref:dolichyl-phosphooligosaccharide-protein glycotransferase n=1 Tax=Methanobacterium lacus (strain AL-21) TaxID=877455 RepID=F0T9W3_METLA|nr:STT3 domain-containing protein [Methanobacterium lacus]ADZ08786.1 Oligosaccharyl transferase STT3 subunit [Methanobacterium lacus]